MPKYPDGLVTCDNCGIEVPFIYFEHGDYILCPSCHGPAKPKTKVKFFHGGVKV